LSSQFPERTARGRWVGDSRTRAIYSGVKKRIWITQKETTMNTKNLNLHRPTAVLAPLSEIAETWRKAVIGDAEARRELLRQLMPRQA
jgi:hypothetical protein